MMLAAVDVQQTQLFQPQRMQNFIIPKQVATLTFLLLDNFVR